MVNYLKDMGDRIVLETHQKKAILSALTTKIFYDTNCALKASLKELFIKQEESINERLNVIFYKGRAFSSPFMKNPMINKNTRLSEELYPEGDKILAHMTALAEQKNKVSNYLTAALSVGKTPLGLRELLDLRVFKLLSNYEWESLSRNDNNPSNLEARTISEFKERHKLGVETILGILFEKTYINT